jgi:hypothetical protein
MYLGFSIVSIVLDEYHLGLNSIWIWMCPQKQLHMFEVRNEFKSLLPEVLFHRR